MRVLGLGWNGINACMAATHACIAAARADRYHSITNSCSTRTRTQRLELHNSVRPKTSATHAQACPFVRIFNALHHPAAGAMPYTFPCAQHLTGNRCDTSSRHAIYSCKLDVATVARCPALFHRRCASSLTEIVRSCSAEPLNFCVDSSSGGDRRKQGLK